jgi:hypothetical protein
MKLENLILGTGVPVDWLEIVNDYTDYISDLDNELMDTSKIDLGVMGRDFGFLNKYKIDVTTHLENIFRTNVYIKHIDFQKYNFN